MSIRDRLRGWLVKAQQTVVRLIPAWSEAKPFWALTDFDSYVTEGYARNEVVYACINEIARSAAEPRLVVENDAGDELDNHPLQELLDKPNTTDSPFEMWELTLIYLNIMGKAYWWKQRSRAGAPVALWHLRPDRVTAIPGSMGVDAYEYRIGSEVYTLPAFDVVRFHYRHPLYPHEEGLSPLAVGARAIDTDNALTAFGKSFFDNSAVPFGVFKSKQILSQERVAEIRQRLREQYHGEDGWHNVMILDENADYQQMGLSQREMGFDNLRMLSETRICMLFQVPPILIGAQAGLNKATYANYQEARRSFWSETLSPLYKRLQDAVQSQLVTDFGDRLNVYWDFSAVNALQENRNEQWARAQLGVQGGFVTINEARAEIGLEPIDGGDELKKPQPLMLPPKPEPEETRPEPEQEQLDEEEEPGAKAVGLSQEDVDEEHAKAFDRVARSWELRFYEAARDQFRSELRQVLGILVEADKARKATKDILDLRNILTTVMDFLVGNGKSWQGVFFELFSGLFVEHGEAVSGRLGVAFDVYSPEVQSFISNYGYKFTEGIQGVTAEHMRQLFDQAYTEGWSIPQTSKALRELYDGWDKTRATLIARSETIRFNNAASVHAYKSGGYTRKRWFARHDERLCGWCAEMHGKELGIDDDYIKVGDSMTYMDGDKPMTLDITYENVGYPPLHPQCRCVVLPAR